MMGAGWKPRLRSGGGAVNKGIRLAMLAAVFLPALFAGCGRHKAIALDERNKLSLAPDIQWAVVKEPYVTYRTDKSWDAATAGYERKGEILQVLGTSVAEDNSVWFYFSNGYLPASAVTIEPNRYRAEHTAKALME